MPGPFGKFTETRQELEFQLPPLSERARGQAMCPHHKGVSGQREEDWPQHGGAGSFTILSLGKRKQLVFGAVDFSVPSSGILS